MIEIIDKISSTNSEINIGYYNSPIGLMKVCSNSIGITEIDFVSVKSAGEKYDSHVADCISQLEEYFNGKRKEFDLTVVLNGTEFQNKVWKSLNTVSYGKTASYKDIARMVGNEKACRAVGMANNKNSVVIVIPCHRVIGSNGTLTGYGGGIDKKQWLLEHEKRSI